MKHVANVRKFRLLILAGAVALTLGMSAKYADRPTPKSDAQFVTICSDALKASVLIADSGSEFNGWRQTQASRLKS